MRNWSYDIGERLLIGEKLRNWSYDIGERLLIGENNEELVL